MKINIKLIIFAIIFSILVLCAFLLIKPQTVVASACISNATQRCVGNSIFWFDSCNRQQDWIKNCSYKCQNGQCINPQPVYTKHYKKACNDNNLYWYDSKGVINDIYKNCSDDNNNTKDSCSDGKCVNEAIVAPIDYTPIIGGIDASVFCGAQGDFINFSKNITIAADQTINCLIIVKNTSTNPIDNIEIRADIPTEIVSVSEIKIDGMAFNGNITSSVNIGSFQPAVSKIITFSGKAISPISQAITKQITGIVISGTLSGSDSVAINFQPGIAEANTASLESSSFASPFLDFFKRWYIWIFAAIALVFLFFVIFRRLSSNV